MAAVEIEQLFEAVSADEWREMGGGGSAERGLYTRVLVTFQGSGERYARLPMDRGIFAGKKASSVATALKNSKDSKNAPDNLETIKISSRGENVAKGITGMVFLENTAADAS
jgi:hypothetical protein